MARKRRESPGAVPEKTRRLTAPVTDSLFRRVGAFTKIRGLKLGDVVQAALESHLRGFYFVDREGPGQPGPAGPIDPDGGASPPVEDVTVEETLTCSPVETADPSPGAGEGSPRPGRRRAAG